MSHTASSAYSKSHLAKAEGEAAWQSTKPSNIKRGQCILWHDKKVEEIIDLLDKFNANEREIAKRRSQTNQHFCIVMGDPETVDDNGVEKVRIPLLHCTKATNSRYRDKIYRPLPHSTKLYTNYKIVREPLEVRDGSPDFAHQTYVVPYEIFYAKILPDAYFLVRTRLLLLIISFQTDEVVRN